MPYATIALLNFMSASGMPWTLNLVKDEEEESYSLSKHDEAELNGEPQPNPRKPTKRSHESQETNQIRKQPRFDIPPNRDTQSNSRKRSHESQESQEIKTRKQTKLEIQRPTKRSHESHESQETNQSKRKK
jgi:hypothetical protein